MSEEHKDPEVLDLIIDEEDEPQRESKSEAETPSDTESSVDDVKSTVDEPSVNDTVTKDNAAQTSDASVSSDDAEKTVDTNHSETAEPIQDAGSSDAANEHDLSGIGHQEAFVDQKAFRQKKKVRRALVATLITLGVILITGYTAMVILCTSHFQPNTVINGVDYSFRSPESVQQEIDARPADYQLHVTLRNGEFTIRPSDIGLVITTAADVQRIKDRQNPFLWFMAYFDQPNDAAYVIMYDENKLDAFLDSVSYLKPENMEAPTNPMIVLNDGVPEIRKGNAGTTIDRDKLKLLIEDRIRNLNREISADFEGCYKKALYDENSDKVKNCRDLIASYTSLKITYLYGEDIRFMLRAEDIYNMLDIDLEKYYCAVSARKVEYFVDQFADEHDTFGKDRIFKTHYGKKLRLNSSYLGWEIDREAEVKTLIMNISRRENIEREPVFTHKGKIYTGDCSDIGDTYVELDLSVQKIYYYVDGRLLIEDDVISGNPNKYQNTPSGLYEIYGMRQNVVLTGPGYASHVDYWMPFNGEIGLHDAYWQSKFGGNLYLTRGSHGCVNLTHSTAQTLYETGFRGLPVICYWRTDDNFIN